MLSCQATTGLSEKTLMMGSNRARTSVWIFTVKLLGLARFAPFDMPVRRENLTSLAVAAG
jgi:hypothetical protein